MEELVVDTGFWKGRRVFLTGHTGFKGGWLALWLTHLGATVRGYSLDPATQLNFFETAQVASAVEDIRGDIRDASALESTLREFAPEVIFHLAAQALVRTSYDSPIETYATNVMGTAHLLDAVRRTPSVRAVVCITTDKCYENKEWIWPYRETDPLGGYDPYSSSKACAEIAAASFRQSYFHPAKLAEHGVAIATARAGNVIGGGDWSTDRLIPDIVRGFLSGTPVHIRNPHSIRPWQHVLEPLHGYIRLAEKLLMGSPKSRSEFATAYNFGPMQHDAQTVAWIADHMATLWGNGSSWVVDEHTGPHEAHYLKLDISRAIHHLGWTPQLGLDAALSWLVDWYQTWQASSEPGLAMRDFTLQQISAYEELLRRPRP
ncbi:CDP-glucose 4,6-dehydratase [Granulicella aggregans]|jgi:CDP-glucose 4,6-dehydratase|uniref:CDP-glucose 4,6-dehydratase n=1 Tax=Granulicella aggregans TaxID=474949 RepID=A0A7W7ZF35_9BACT|nr:CDP-glucose 4,6-dehydratase [Granulicella aggregans]MBB5058780.1 CDP-glucose 4,6-dehydratase [Granulicella aggregans]